jgi:hypothetical protein
MHIRLRIQHWVLWWFGIGVVLGAVALVNVLARDLSHAQDKIVVAIGMLHWLIGGVFCYGLDAVQIEDQHPAESASRVNQVRDTQEWHAASDFILPGNRRRLLPPRY